MSAVPVPPAERRAGPCPFCGNWEVAEVTECRDLAGRHVCDLYLCRACGKHFAWDVRLPADLVAAVGEERRRGDERRHASRFRVQFVLEVLFANDRSPRVATVLDASYGGVCFLYPEPLAVGTRGRVRLSLPSGLAPFPAEAQVVRSTPTPGGAHVVAVEFVEVDPAYRSTLERYIQSARPPAA